MRNILNKRSPLGLITTLGIFWSGCAYAELPRYTVRDLASEVSVSIATASLNDDGIVSGMAYNPAHQGAQEAYTFNTNTGAFHFLSPVPNQLNSSAIATNHAGETVGSFQTLVSGDWQIKPFIKSADGGTLVPEVGQMDMVDLNNNGMALGNSLNSSLNSYASSVIGIRDGSVQQLSIPNMGTLNSTGINSSGQVTGYAAPTASDIEQTRAFVWSSSTGFSFIPTDAKTFAFAINDRGTVVGALSDHGNLQPFIFSQGQVHELNPADSGQGQAMDINNCEQTIGTSSPMTEGSFSWISQNGEIARLSDLAQPGNYSFDYAGSINNRGQIIVMGRSAGSFTFLLLSPTTQIDCNARKSTKKAPTLIVQGQ